MIERIIQELEKEREKFLYGASDYQASGNGTAITLLNVFKDSLQSFNNLVSEVCFDDVLIIDSDYAVNVKLFSYESVIVWRRISPNLAEIVLHRGPLAMSGGIDLDITYKEWRYFVAGIEQPLIVALGDNDVAIYKLRKQFQRMSRKAIYSL